MRPRRRQKGGLTAAAAGIAGIAALAALLAAGCRRGNDWNLLVVTLDTTRADALGCYGNPAAATPHLDRLAREGVLFERALTAIPITTPSHSTIFTGTYPMAHGVRDNGRFRLAPSATTLAEILQQQGFATGAAVGAFPLTRNWGLDQGFDFYDDHVTVASEDEAGRRVAPVRMFFDERPASRVNDAILPWLREHGRERFFAWVHYWDAHQPHVPPPPFSDLFAQNLYQGEIAYVDQAFGVVMEELRRLGVADRTVVLVVADHGEGLGEHGEDTHSMLLYDATLHVPLLLSYPGARPGARIAEQVGTVDIVPTVLELLGLPPAADAQGRSLVDLAAHPERPASNRRTYYAETLSPRLSYGWGEQRALFSEQWKLLHGPRLELYDLAADRRELRNLAPADPTELLTTALATFVARNARASAAGAVSEIDVETRNRLAALGYLSGSGEAPTVEERLRRDGDPPQQHIGNVSLWSRCKTHLERRDYLAARELADILVRRDAQNAFYRALLASAELGLGRFTAAATVAEGGPINAQNDAIYLQIATALFSSGLDARAVALTRRVAAEAPSALAHYNLGEMLGTLGESAEHERELRAALELDADFGRARQSLAILLAGSGRLDLAEAEFRDLVARRPLDPAARLNFATFLFSRERYADAERELDRALDLAPDYFKAQLARATLFAATGRDAAARELAARIAAQCPDPRLVAQANRLAEAP